MKKNLITHLLFLLTATAYSQAPCDLWPRYDQEVFTVVDTTADLTYGSNTDYQGVNTILKMDVYQPSGDTLEKRPLIIFAHGGSFVFGDKSNQDQIDLCTHFAKRGYVTATINYRLGIAFPINASTASQAVYRALHDMKAAIRYFRKDAATADSFGIDTSRIFIGGTSAGAFTALHSAYMDSYAELPAGIDTAVLGDLEGTSGNPGYPSNAHAVINLCGALGSSQFIQPGDIPLVSMHGTDDQTVPYNTQMLYLFGIAPIMVVEGSYSIHTYLQTIGHDEAMYTWYGADHVPYDGTNATAVAYLDTTLRFVSNFLYQQLGCTPSDPEPLPNTGITTFLDEDALNLISVINHLEHQNLEIKAEENMTLMLYSIAGELVKQQLITAGNSSVSTAGLMPGIYFIHCKTVDKQVVFKILTL